jgi:glycosyltransferase involved in cell wall biosynthesis
MACRSAAGVGEKGSTMRILHVIPSVDLRTGGPAEGLKQLCRIYVQYGHEVEVATLDAPAAAAELEFPAPIHGLGPCLGIYGFTLRALPWFKANLSRFDVVILNSIWQYSTLAAYWALRGSGIPYGVFTHGMLDPYFKYRYPLKHVKKSIYWHLILGKIMREAGTIYFTSEEEKVLARLSFPRYRVHETVVRYGSLGPDCDLDLAAQEFLNRWPQLHDKRVAISLGRIHPKKATDLLIQAFAATWARDPQWRLVIAGPDQVGWRRELEALAARLGVTDRILWTGMLEGALKWGSLAAAEVFVLPSHQENFGVVVAEAQACGLPVILSNKVNIWREVEQSESGLICDDTAQSTASAMQRWSELTAEQVLKFRQRSRQCFDEQFSYATNAQRVVHSVEILMDEV